MRYFFNIIIICLLCACSQHQSYERVKRWMIPNGKVKVLTTIAMIEDLAKEVGGEHVDTLTLVSGELDPHTYQLVKGDDEKLAFADVIFYNGLGLEHGPSLRSFLEDSTKAVGLGNLIRDAQPDIILQYNGAIDPHIWMDVEIWAKTVDHIVETLSKYDPSNAAAFAANGDTLKQSLLELHITL